ncbi:MAG TPA: substrate-binding domain-containing protein [Melioribacteraceae bacterium]|nr:substrate-binding domain-containing protein [Melioribacteraceae bacterium]
MKVLINLFILISFISCKNEVEQVLDTPTSGEITISADETFLPIINSQINTFESLYTNTKINVNYIPQAYAFKNLLMDSSRFIIVSRPLNKEELKYFKNLEIVPTQTKICYDGLALITNKNNPDTNLTFEQVKAIFEGDLTEWNELNKSSKLGKLVIVFDNANSGTYQYVKNRFPKADSKRFYSLKNNRDVIEYVSKNSNAIGIIGVNWISDFDDKNTQAFYKTINVVGIKSDMPNTDPNMYYKPYQAYIALKIYPLYREVYIISREARTGLGTGLAAFIAGEKGQRIFLKSGLVPATMPVRLIETYNEQL